MSAAGKYAHFQNQKRHAQRSINQPRARVETIESATWLSGAMGDSRALSAQLNNDWSIQDFADLQGIELEESERRLRKLCSLGFLRIKAQWAGGKFVEYRFGMVNINLPR